ncbi:cobalamin B12-binding domain-containing protein [Niallia taxi]|uniref:cobalamin B12-binding domain-containing protein n=1 Tax=Niallia taxi TaxID=2499688 RepID=UPI002AA5D030|nr:cobalamin-dependent protein [Niallia taxi]MED3964552.1 cobalamin-dependent protein [Niallia taxi]
MTHFVSAKEFALALLEGNIQKSMAIIQELDYQGYHTAFIYDELITPAMKYIGELWQRNEISVAEEHLATGICEVILSHYMLNIQQADTQEKKVLLFCLEGEHHTIGLKMCASTFQENGWEVKNLGPNLPLEHAVYMARKWKPDVIGMSLSMSFSIPTLRPYIEELERLAPKPAIIVGSRLIQEYDLQQYCSPSTIFISEQSELKSWLQKYNNANSLIHSVRSDNF